MRTLLVTGSDTGVGKTRVVAALAQLLSGGPAAEVRSRVQIVKVVETGAALFGGGEGDATTACRLAGVPVAGFTLASYRAPVTPAAAAEAEGREVSFAGLLAAVTELPPCDWRILEGAGGVATPLDAAARDWADFARAVRVDAVIVVVPDRLGAINQGRLAFMRAAQAGAPTGVWLNALDPVDALVARSSREGLRAAGVPLWGEQACDSVAPRDPLYTLQCLLTATQSREPSRAGEAGTTPESAGHAPAAGPTGPIAERCAAALAERERHALRRRLRVTPPSGDILNLADNDYLDLARDPAIAEAVAFAARAHGTSASASPLITGWREPHAEFTARLAHWHGFACGMLWTSGYAANAAILGGLPRRGDLVFADRLIHASMIAGLLRSGARLQRYEHLGLERLEQLLAAAGADRPVVVATESVFSMDGDYPDLRRLAALKQRYGFFWIVDEAHALGWYGPQGAGLVRAAGVERHVDVLVGTLGKSLASGGAYALFQDERVRDHLVNTAGEFVYSTALAPTNVAAAAAACDRIVALADAQPAWHRSSRSFRAQLRAAGWRAPDGDSPIVPVMLGGAAATVALVESLRAAGIIAGAVRPPTVPAGTSRVRFSLKRTFGNAEATRVLAAMEAWRAAS